jgi:hypothetical protein
VERKRKEEYTSALERLILYEEVSWRHKFKVLWLRESDTNGFFFFFFTGWEIQIEEIIPWTL